jgi:hypothetical protein
MRSAGTVGLTGGFVASQNAEVGIVNKVNEATGGAFGQAAVACLVRGLMK